MFSLESLTSKVIYRLVLPILAISLVLVSNVLVFTVVPNEKVMGAVQRIFYFHVGSAMASYLMIAILFVASVFYLVNRHKFWDAIGRAAASVGLLLCSVVLATGMIWGNSAWNTWWRWEPRLVSFLVLWLILFSFVVFRSFAVGGVGSEKGRNFSAVLGIISAVNVPIVIFSVKLLDHSEQLHPEVVAKQGLRDASYVYTLVLAIIAMLLFSLWLFKLKFVNVLLSEKMDSIEREIN